MKNSRRALIAVLAILVLTGAAVLAFVPRLTAVPSAESHITHEAVAPPVATADPVPAGPAAEKTSPLDKATGDKKDDKKPKRVKVEPPGPEEAPPGLAANRKQKSLADAASTPIVQQGTARSKEALGQPRGPVAPDAAIGSLGGCLADYGTDGQCLPVIPPSLAEHAQAMLDAGLDPASMPHPWSCQEARTLFPEGISLRQASVDPQSLDTDEDGLACEPGQ